VRLERIAQDLVHCVPLPDWVDYQPYRSDIPDTEVSCVGNGTCRLLSDAQLNLRHPEQAWHCRTVQRVLTREGAQRVAHVVAEFDPGFQRLEIHFISVVRGGERIEHAKAEAFQLLRRETNLERLIFDGRLTPSLLIPDVRIGDVVEVGVTVYGSAPVLGGMFAGWFAFDSLNPWFEDRQRLIRPRSRRITMKEFNNPPERNVVEDGETEDSRWMIAGQQRREPEVLTPSWLILNPAVQFSEFESWNDVARLLAPFYLSDGFPEALTEEVNRLAAAHADPAERAVEWLRFVQRELRYFAFSLGEGGLTPRKLGTIWSTRFGDCKDASTLYVAGARQLGLDACAALVSTTHGLTLNEVIPSVGVFDHCIVRLRLDGKSYWLDPTMSIQSGSLQNIFQPHAGWALTLSPGTAHLEQMGGDEPLSIIHLEDDVTFGPKRVSPAILHRRIDYLSWAADATRNRIANEGLTTFSQAMLKELQSRWPGVLETSSVEVHDDRIRNCLTLALSYEIPDCWKPGSEGSRLEFFIAAGVSGDLQPLSAGRRETEIFLGRPRKITGVIQFHMPSSWQGGGWSNRLEASGVTYTDRFRIDGRSIIESRELTIDAWSIPAREAEAYNEIAKKLQADILTIWARERFGRIRPWTGIKGRLLNGISNVWHAIWIVWLLIIILKVVMFVLR
jgi:hypothetical protein